MDFVVAHQYGGRVKSYEEYAQHTQSWCPRARGLCSIDDFAPWSVRGQIEVLVTEFSSYVGKTTDPTRKLNDMFNALCTFEMLAEMVAADPRVRFTHFWVTHSPWGSHRSKANDVAFAPDNTVLPQGRAVEIMARFIGDRLVATQTSTPAIHAWASVSKRSAVAIWLLNRDTTSVAASIALKGISPSPRCKVGPCRQFAARHASVLGRVGASADEARHCNDGRTATVRGRASLGATRLIRSRSLTDPATLGLLLLLAVQPGQLAGTDNHVLRRQFLLQILEPRGEIETNWRPGRS